MKTSLTVIRWFVGILFIFSGLVKANDPLGLSYKMQEFFEVWQLNQFHDYTLTLAILMNAFEIIAGVAVIIGWRMRAFSWLLLLLIVFFTFLTGYALLSGKIKTCGCFGDCLPLTPLQSFLKDVLLLLLIAFILVKYKLVQPLFKRTIFNGVVLVLAFLFSFGLQAWVLRYLPVVDCLPYRKGNNLVELSRMPADAVPDQFEFRFIYEKGGEQQEFALGNLPDSTWTFVDRKQFLVRKGKNNEPPVKDLIFRDGEGNDQTAAILQQEGRYFLLFLLHANGLRSNAGWVREAARIAAAGRLYIISSRPEDVQRLFAADPVLGGLPVYSCDGTAIKTAARAVPVLYAMEGPVVQAKWAAPHFHRVPL
ncbi:MAG TPA: DoxX family protein [Lacibacter sp.]|nr:DoxX family protein [Lacibacter sp.]